MPRTSLGRHLIGNRPATALLERAIDGDRLSHAYLFVGPPSVGKTTLARAFAQALNCSGHEHGQSERPCGICRACRLTAEGAYPDFRLVQVGRAEAESGHSFAREPSDKVSRVITIDQVRALQHDAGLSPYEGRFKVYVLDAQALNLSAANCLLKTLEEPPAQVILILTSTDPDGLLPTIVSRCQIIRLSSVPVADLEQALVERFAVERFAVEPDRARVLAHLSAGRPGFAIGAVEDPRMLDMRTSRLADLVSLGHGSRVERFAYAEKLAHEHGRDPEGVAWTLGLWLGWWRDLLLTRLGCDEMVANYDFLDELKARARALSLSQIQAALSGVERTLEQLGQNVNARLALEVLLLDVPTVGS